MTFRTLSLSMLFLILLPSLFHVSVVANETTIGQVSYNAGDVKQGSTFTVVPGCPTPPVVPLITAQEPAGYALLTTNDPWIVDKEHKLPFDYQNGVMTTGVHGIVPKDAPLGVHSIPFRCQYYFSKPGFSASDGHYTISINVVKAEGSISQTTSITQSQPTKPGNTEPICSRLWGLWWLECIFHYPTQIFNYKCIIATAAYGSEMAPEVVHMRTVRDNMIGGTPTGRILRDAFNLWYYSWSPPVASWISTSDTLRAVFRVSLIPIVVIVNVAESIFRALGGGELGAVTGFVVAAMLSVVTYIMLPAIVLVWVLTRLYRKTEN